MDEKSGRMSVELYEPIMRKVNAWIFYEKNKPTGQYIGNERVHDEFRKKYDLDCALTSGSLYADTIFSLWRPLRFALVKINGYSKLNRYGDINKKTEFLVKLKEENLWEELLPYKGLGNW